MDLLCLRAQEALIAGDLPSDLHAHVEVCRVCDRVRRISEMLVARSCGAAHVSIAGVFTPGQELLRYRLDALIGEGGQGAVFRATELDVPDSVVALKFVHLDGARADESAREVSYAKRINHPNVCRVHHTTTYGSFRVIEMEYLSDGTLARRLTAGPLAREDALRLFRGVLAGMEAVHRHGILHLDLKPLNVLLRDGGEPVVTDFGLAVRPGGEAAGGTAGWTAPEVCRGEAADARADVYSLGALLGALVPSSSDALAAVVTRATATRPEDRYPTVEALRLAFDATAENPGAAGRRRGSLLVVIPLVLAAAVLVGGALGSGVLRRRATSSPAAGRVDAASSSEGPGAKAGGGEEAMVSIPAGSFRMGSPDGFGEKDEHPQHLVRLNAFQMDRTEVTVAAYDACVQAGRCTVAGTDNVSAACNKDRADRANHPINCVSWSQADEYCRWSGKRLPTEEEWEYAARGTDGRSWPWGNDPPSGQLCWARWKTLQGTCAVGAFPQGDSPFGLHDMAGNLWEWTSTGFSTDYSHPPDPVLRINRGGCWYDADPSLVRSARRDRNALSGRFDYLGFRCAR